MKNYETPEMNVMVAVSDTRLAGEFTSHDMWENSKLAFVVDQQISDSEPV